jgi:hypothetical protein
MKRKVQKWRMPVLEVPAGPDGPAEIRKLETPAEVDHCMRVMAADGAVTILMANPKRGAGSAMSAAVCYANCNGILSARLGRVPA